MKSINFVASPPLLPSPLAGEGEGEGASQTIGFIIGIKGRIKGTQNLIHMLMIFVPWRELSFVSP
jgi:hypothetical protein